MTTNDPERSMMDIHNEALASVDEAYHIFLLIYQQQEKCIYGFVEGKDDPAFYRYLLRREIPEDWDIKLIPAGNKGKVMMTHAHFDWQRFSPFQICFFVDRDLQDYIGARSTGDAPNLYITDGYSIENHVIDNRLLKDVLRDVFQISLLHPSDEQSILGVAERWTDSFNQLLIPLMAQILVWRRENAKANLSNFNLSNCITFDRVNFNSVPRDEMLEIASKEVGCDLSQHDVLAVAEAEFIAHPQWKNMIRGKYVLWFFIKLCEAIWVCVPQILDTYKIVPQRRVEYGAKNAFVILGPRLTIPASLKLFVANTFLKHIAASCS